MNTVKSKRTIVGVVVSDKMDKSITIAVNRLVPHELYGKYVKRTSKLMAHDEENICKVGDKVEVSSCRPLSKNKVWKLDRIIEKTRS